MIASIADMEDDVLATKEMADAVFNLLGEAVVHGATKGDLAAILRCVVHLRNHAEAVLKLWDAACQSEAQH